MDFNDDDEDDNGFPEPVFRCDFKDENGDQCPREFVASEGAVSLDFAYCDIHCEPGIIRGGLATKA